jgi:hypothetical protein
MARTQRQKQAALYEFRERILGATVSVGLLGAVLWGFNHPEHVSRCTTSGPSNSVLARCTSHTLTAVAIHWVVIVVVGFAAGALVGVMLLKLIPTARRA